MARTRRASDRCATKNVWQPARSQRRGDLVDAAAVGVALDHGGAFARHHPRVQHLVVGGDGAEVDGQDAAGLLQARARRWSWPARAAARIAGLAADGPWPGIWTALQAA